ncbi:MAG: peptide MFS transporter [Gammaproteobacteria bacterium]|nr:peptide MFS transporter [Gammaproteobacteria bacterium]
MKPKATLPSKSNLSQPAVIPVFFATEMWERFGFYMIQGLLVLYMTSQIFGFSDAKSYSILGAFTALSYIMPIFGGYVASRILDFEHAVILGGLLLITGYALLSLPHENLFYIALAIITIGTGLFKPSISSYLGDFYKTEDNNREKGYTIFYVGINLGILLSTMTSGYLVRYFGWHMPFLFASIGLLIGTCTFVSGMHYLKRIKNFHRIKSSIATKKPLSIALVYIGILFFTLISYEIILNRSIANGLMLWGGVLIFIGLIFYAFRYDTVVRNKMLACIFLILISIVFWAIYFQMFFSMNLFIERAVDRQFFQFKLPAPIFPGLESVFLIGLGFYVAHLWQKLASLNKNPGSPLKFALSMLSMAIAFFIIFLSTRYINAAGMIDKSYIVIAYLFVTIGELLLSPIGLNMVTILVPQELIGLMMGVWFVALGLGVKLAGVIADYSAIPKHIILLSTIDGIYGEAFLKYAILSLICAVICLVCVPFLNKMIRE